MKQRRIAVVLIVLLCAMALLSGVFLILHMEHDCQKTDCSVCMMLSQTSEVFLYLLVLLAGNILHGGLKEYGVRALQENPLVPDSPVRRKVKLQD